MWIKTQDGELINSDKVYRFYADNDNRVYAQIEAGERWEDLTVGKYKTAEKSKNVLKNIFSALHHKETTFEMSSKEEVS